MLFLYIAIGLYLLLFLVNFTFIIQISFSFKCLHRNMLTHHLVTYIALSTEHLLYCIYTMPHQLLSLFRACRAWTCYLHVCPPPSRTRQAGCCSATDSGSLATTARRKSRTWRSNCGLKQIWKWVLSNTLAIFNCLHIWHHSLMGILA